MNRKQLTRIADALETLASNSTEQLVLMRASCAIGDQNLGTHASMFGELTTMISPLLAGAAAKMNPEAAETPKPEPALPPQPKVIERNGIRLAAADPHEIKVEVK